ncbi:hypothetical protein GCM10025794_35700 [Massilia kyonggiensis]|nr:hypothetical protein [Massilia kyonggiensis]
MKNPAAAIRVLYAACLAGAAWNHARIVFEHGIAWDYGGVPPFVAAFWTSLTFFDALAVVLLLARPRAGVALTALIIVCDVIVNTYVGLAYGFDVASFAAQCLFLVFVLGTVRRTWAPPQLSPALARLP